MTIKRRQFNRYLGQCVAAAMASPLLLQCDRTPQSSRSNRPQPLPTLRSQQGLLEATLTAQQSQRRSSNGAPGVQLSYNGNLPGPTLEARPGDTVRLTLINQLTLLERR